MRGEESRGEEREKRRKEKGKEIEEKKRENDFKLRTYCYCSFYVQQYFVNNLFIEKNVCKKLVLS